METHDTQSKKIRSWKTIGEVASFMITCVFGELQGGRVVQKGVYVKMARGEMVRYLAETKAETPEALKAFAVSDYHYDPERSDATTYVFTRTAVPGKAGSR